MSLDPKKRPTWEYAIFLYRELPLVTYMSVSFLRTLRVFFEREIRSVHENPSAIVVTVWWLTHTRMICFAYDKTKARDEQPCIICYSICCILCKLINKYSCRFVHQQISIGSRCAYLSALMVHAWDSTNASDGQVIVSFSRAIYCGYRSELARESRILGSSNLHRYDKWSPCDRPQCLCGKPWSSIGSLGNHYEIIRCGTKTQRRFLTPKCDTFYDTFQQRQGS